MIKTTANYYPPPHGRQITRTPLAISLMWMYRLVRLGLGAIFIWSGASKLADPQAFYLIIEAYGVIPDLLILPVALGLSLLEVAAGVGLWLDIRGSLEVITALLILFMTILSYGLWMGLDVDCGCFGSEDPEGAAYHGLWPALIRDALMLGGIVYLYIYRRRLSLQPTRLRHLYSLIFSRRS